MKRIIFNPITLSVALLLGVFLSVVAFQGCDKQAANTQGVEQAPMPFGNSNSVNEGCYVLVDTLPNCKIRVSYRNADNTFSSCIYDNIKEVASTHVVLEMGEPCCEPVGAGQVANFGSSSLTCPKELRLEYTCVTFLTPSGTSKQDFFQNLVGCVNTVPVSFSESDTLNTADFDVDFEEICIGSAGSAITVGFIERVYYQGNLISSAVLDESFNPTASTPTECVPFAFTLASTCITDGVGTVEQGFMQQQITDGGVVVFTTFFRADGTTVAAGFTACDSVAGTHIDLEQICIGVPAGAINVGFIEVTYLNGQVVASRVLDETLNPTATPIVECMPFIFNTVSTCITDGTIREDGFMRQQFLDGGVPVATTFLRSDGVTAAAGFTACDCETFEPRAFNVPVAGTLPFLGGTVHSITIVPDPTITSYNVTFGGAGAITIPQGKTFTWSEPDPCVAITDVILINNVVGVGELTVATMQNP